jgi:hypothetical protein
MNILQLKIVAADFDKLIDYLNENFTFDYENQSSDTAILASEQYYIRNNSTQLNMIIINKEEDSVLIDIIGGAGGSGILNLNWGSEQGYINKVRLVLNKYAEDNKLTLEEL